MKNKEEIANLLKLKIKEACLNNGIDYSQLNINNEFNLLQSGVFNSLSFLELIASLEDELKIDIDLSEITPDEFVVLGNLTKIVNSIVENTNE